MITLDQRVAQTSKSPRQLQPSPFIHTLQHYSPAAGCCRERPSSLSYHISSLCRLADLIIHYYITLQLRGATEDASDALIVLETRYREEVSLLKRQVAEKTAELVGQQSDRDDLFIRINDLEGQAKRDQVTTTAHPFTPAITITQPRG